LGVWALNQFGLMDDETMQNYFDSVYDRQTGTYLGGSVMAAERFDPEAVTDPDLRRDIESTQWYADFLGSALGQIIPMIPTGRLVGAGVSVASRPLAKKLIERGSITPSEVAAAQFVGTSGIVGAVQGAITPEAIDVDKAKGGDLFSRAVLGTDAEGNTILEAETLGDILKRGGREGIVSSLTAFTNYLHPIQGLRAAGGIKDKLNQSVTAEAGRGWARERV
jgi:hypothetical protein